MSENISIIGLDCATEPKNVRKEIVNGLRDCMVIPKNMEILEENADALDSAVCLLAAKNFLDGEVYFPEQLDLAKREGWIWVRKLNG